MLLVCTPLTVLLISNLIIPDHFIGVLGHSLPTSHTTSPQLVLPGVGLGVELCFSPRLAGLPLPGM